MVEEEAPEAAEVVGVVVVVDHLTHHTIVAHTITQEVGKALITTMEWCIIIIMETNVESMIWAVKRRERNGTLYKLLLSSPYYVSVFAAVLSSKPVKKVAKAFAISV